MYQIFCFVFSLNFVHRNCWAYIFFTLWEGFNKGSKLPIDKRKSAFFVSIENWKMHRNIFKEKEGKLLLQKRKREKSLALFPFLFLQISRLSCVWVVRVGCCTPPPPHAQPPGRLPHLYRACTRWKGGRIKGMKGG